MTAKRFTSMYNEQSDMIQYVDTLKEEPNKWSICNVSETLKKLNELHEENQELRLQLNLCSDQRNEFHRGARENANRVGKMEKENEHIKHTIKTMMENERTELGQSVLKQLWEQIE